LLCCAHRRSQSHDLALQAVHLGAPLLEEKLLFIARRDIRHTVTDGRARLNVR
jgi:hypothetical protein